MNPLRKILALAINHFLSPKGLAFGLASNIDAEAIGDGEWLKLSPYFEGDYWEQDGKTWKKYRQVVSRQHGQRLVTAFNTLKAAKGDGFRGLPIYRGHPDADPERWPDESRLGGIMDVEARDDGIYVKAAWNDEGERNRKQGYLVYPSPAWPYDQKLKTQSGRIEPIELRSIGMTNTPRIHDVPAWTNADPALQPPTNETMLKTLLCKILGIAETSTDEEITTAGEAFVAKKAAADAAAVKALAVEKQKAIAANAEAEKFRNLAINSLKSSAIDSGKVTAAEWPSYETRLAVDFDVVASEIAAKKPAVNTDPLKINKRGDDLSTPAGRRLAFNARIDELTAPVSRGGNGLSMDAAINAMRANPDDAALLKAMEAPAAS